jgi:hypothetical protein
VNAIATVRARKAERTYLEIEIDGTLLSHHFAGRAGAHPAQLSPLGWSTGSSAQRAETVAQFLGEKPSELKSAVFRSSYAKNAVISRVEPSPFASFTKAIASGGQIGYTRMVTSPGVHSIGLRSPVNLSSTKLRTRRQSERGYERGGV